MSCQDCYNNCTDAIQSDKCVRYTGPAVPELGICTGDPLSSVEKALIDKLLSFADASGVTVPSLTPSCDLLKTFLTQDKSLSALLDGYGKAICSLLSTVAGLSTQQSTPTAFDTGCLTGLSAAPTKDQILQVLLNKACALDTRVGAIEADYVKASGLSTLVTQIITQQSAPSAGPSTQYNQRLVPFFVYEYYGSLSNFDSTGKGLISAGFDKVYLCNGLNGTPDKRGRVAVGAVQNVPGATLDPAIDARVSFGVKQTFGQSQVILSEDQIPAHTHGVNDPGHSHSVAVGNDSASGSKFDNFAKNNGNDHSLPSTVSTTGITLASTGGGAAHTNVQPSIGALFVIYLP
jgi:microcystin-dependent protein